MESRPPRCHSIRPRPTVTNPRGSDRVRSPTRCVKPREVSFAATVRNHRPGSQLRAALHTFGCACDFAEGWHIQCSVPLLEGQRWPGAILGKDTTGKGWIVNPRHYVDLKETTRDLQPTYYFMINCLLYSRMETGLVSNQDFYDEDVNVYLAHLLHSFINPEYVEQSKKFLSRYDVDVFRRFASSSDARIRYVIHKTNADFLLVSTGVFDNPGPPLSPRTQAQPSEEAYVGRGKTYYHFAYTYSQQMHRKNAGVAEVLEKLSVGFDRYLKILSHMREIGRAHV